MQNSPYPPPPGNPYGNQPPAKKGGLSKGCLIGIIAAVVLGVGAIVLIVAVGLGGLYWANRQAKSVASGDYSSGDSSTSSSGDAGDQSAEEPSPTSAQSAAVSGGQTVNWDQQEISWTVPQKWSKSSVDSRSLLWRSPGSADAASLIVSISPMSADFPMEESLKAFYSGAQTRKQNGEVNEVHWLKLNGVRGVEFRESAPEDPEGAQRLQWMAYRNYKGQKQLINVMLASRGKDFARHEDALYGILYSTKLSK